MVQTPTPSCWLIECKDCEDSEFLLYMFKEKLKSYFEDKGTDNVTIHQWVNTDRSNLDVKTMKVDDFIDLLFDLMSNLRPHHFIAKDQTKYFIESRENLQPSEVIVSGDFSENYNFIVQIAHSLSTGTMVAVQFTLGRFIIGLKERREYSTSHMQ